MRILLVEPSFHSFMKYDRWYYPTSLALLAAILHQKGHEVRVYDGDRYFEKDAATRNRNVFISKQSLYYDNVNDFNHEIWQHLKKVLVDFKPDIVGVSIFTCKLHSALNTLRLVKEVDPAVKTCVGGAHATAGPGELIENEHIDAVFTGYADHTFPRWIEEGAPGGIMEGSGSEMGIAELPYVRRQALMFPEHYTQRDLSQIMTSRGCVGRCTFCSNPFMWSGKPKFRTSESIRAELTELREEWGITSVLVGDSSFSDIPSECKRVAGLLKEAGMRWSANVRWSTVTRDLLECFMDCGCYRISVGLESGSDKVLRYMKKGCTKEIIRRKAKMINDLGLEWQLFTITGFPVETVEDMRETVELALEINPTSVSLNSLSPLPGTDVYKDIPGLTPDFAASVNQLHPSHCFSQHLELESFQEMFVHMTEKIEAHNAKQRENRLTYTDNSGATPPGPASA